MNYRCKREQALGMKFYVGGAQECKLAASMYFLPEIFSGFSQ